VNFGGSIYFLLKMEDVLICSKSSNRLTQPIIAAKVVIAREVNVIFFFDRRLRTFNACILTGLRCLVECSYLKKSNKKKKKGLV